VFKLGQDQPPEGLITLTSTGVIGVVGGGACVATAPAVPAALVAVELLAKNVRELTLPPVAPATALTTLAVEAPLALATAPAMVPVIVVLRDWLPTPWVATATAMLDASAGTTLATEAATEAIVATLLVAPTPFCDITVEETWAAIWAAWAGATAAVEAAISAAAAGADLDAVAAI